MYLESCENTRYSAAVNVLCQFCTDVCLSRFTYQHWTAAGSCCWRSLCPVWRRITATTATRFRHAPIWYNMTWFDIIWIRSCISYNYLLGTTCLHRQWNIYSCYIYYTLYTYDMIYIYIWTAQTMEYIYIYI